MTPMTRRTLQMRELSAVHKRRWSPHTRCRSGRWQIQCFFPDGTEERTISDAANRDSVNVRRSYEKKPRSLPVVGSLPTDLKGHPALLQETLWPARVPETIALVVGL